MKTIVNFPKITKNGVMQRSLNCVSRADNPVAVQLPYNGCS